MSRAVASGRVLAETVLATMDLPQGDVSAMDGFACGVANAETPLPVVGVAAAGAPPQFKVGRGQAARVMTGAVLPSGTDRVVPVEQARCVADTAGRETVVFEIEPAARAHVRSRGEVIRQGDALLTAGSRLGPAAVSLLAAHGHPSVRVRAQPSVAVLATGDEVVPADEEPGPGQLRDSNSAFLRAAGRDLGLNFRSLGIAPDRPDELSRLVAEGQQSDVLLLCGGVSMGEFDFVEEVLVDRGCRVLFHGVAVQPGKPLVVARGPSTKGGWIIGLPGNPGSVTVTFRLFVRPLLRRLLGFEDGFWHGALAGRLDAPLPAGKSRDRFFPAAITFAGSESDDLLPRVRPLRGRGSHDLGAFGSAGALVRVRPGAVLAAEGERCEILPFADWS